MFILFDLLHRDGRELTGRPLREHRARREDAVADNDLVLPVRRLARNGFDAWSEVVARDYEGYVAKDETDLYDAGPTRRWLKVKQKGWTDQEERWQRRISAGAGARVRCDRVEQSRTAPAIGGRLLAHIRQRHCTRKPLGVVGGAADAAPTAPTSGC